uniref:uncharacterized protein LOC101304679 n=1 Tax=Fragaria vesca subsp. vesca TaxID=101020 RepID=UPI0005C99970|nr:PREDICTED: uncharacterized protein LOC101304679 [Fragaria vesca subsp. vesca]XP_011464139.1 PREDICTED: uncharacterized protein LOC101304679 [Fragaria vesca subsp. vesca]
MFNYKTKPTKPKVTHTAFWRRPPFQLSHSPSSIFFLLFQPSPLLHHNSLSYQNMAGGNHPKGPPHKPSSSSSAASNRKSRWESSPSTNNKNNQNHRNKNPPDPKPATGPSPKPGKTASPANPKHPPAPSPGAAPPFPFPDPSSFGPPPPPVYGFHNLERRTIVLADGTVRSYFALPPDYQDFPPPHMDPSGRFLPFGPGGPAPDYWNSLGIDGRGGPQEGSSMKRKFGEEEEHRDKGEELAKRRQQLVQLGNPNGFPAGPSSPFRREMGAQSRSGDDPRASKFMRTGGGFENVGFRQSGGSGGGGGDNVGHKYLQVDQAALKKAFLYFAKVINENGAQKKIYIEDGKQGRLNCLACGTTGRSAKDFPDMHSLIMHSYNTDNADIRVDHLGLHKALCVLMGWNYLKPPDNSKAYQFLSADEAAANQDDLIMWPPMVIIHNTLTGKSKDGRMEGLGNKAMDSYIRALGFGSGKSKSLYGRDGHLGTTIIKFSADEAGLKEALRMTEFFEKDNHGRRAWYHVQPLTMGNKDDENNPYLVKLDEKTREKKRVFYGYLGTASDLEKVDFDTRKKAAIESWREFKPPK